MQNCLQASEKASSRPACLFDGQEICAKNVVRASRQHITEQSPPEGYPRHVEWYENWSTKVMKYWKSEMRLSISVLFEDDATKPGRGQSLNLESTAEPNYCLGQFRRRLYLSLCVWKARLVGQVCLLVAYSCLGWTVLDSKATLKSFQSLNCHLTTAWRSRLLATN